MCICSPPKARPSSSAPSAAPAVASASGPAPAGARDSRGPCSRCSTAASATSTGSARKQRKNAVVAAGVPASLTRIADAEMLPAPRTASSSGRRSGREPPWSLLVMTVLAYGADMMSTLRELPDRGQSGFGPYLLEALAAGSKLINTGRAAAGEGLRVTGDVQAFGDRYAFHGIPAGPRDVARLRAHRARLGAVAVACEAGDDAAAIEMLNALLAQTGAIPQIVAHDGRGPHIHVSRPAAPLSDRIAAHLAMGLAELVVAGEAHRVRSCASPSCRDVFVDLSRNRSRRYCDSRTCGNRLHVAAYRARRSAAS